MLTKLHKKIAEKAKDKCDNNASNSQVLCTIQLTKFPEFSTAVFLTQTH